MFLCFYVCTTSVLSKNIPFIESEIEKEITSDKVTSAKDSSIDNVSHSITKEVSSSIAVKAFRNFKSLERFDTPISDKQPEKFHQKTGFNFNTADSIENNKWLEMAKDVFSKIEETKNYIDELKDESLGELPVAINPIEISNVKYTVGIAKAVFKPQYTELTIFLKIETARGVLILGADDIKLSHEGGIVGDAKLNLISQFTVNFNNGSVLLTLNGGFEKTGTYATIDCSGFKELGIDANIQFSNGLIYPVDEDGKETLGYVESSFKVVASDWNDMLINISLPEFGIKGVEGTTFRLNTAIFDFSDLRNDPQTPSDYLTTYYNEAPELWRGVYIQSLEVVLPKAFAKRGSENRVTFGATDMIIDSQGVSGKFTGENILTIDEGSASKWQFSLEYFKLEIETNSLKAGEFSGEFLLPVSSVDRLKYNAIIQPDEYSFRVASTDEIDFDLWNAKVTLTKDSYIEMKIKDDKFRPKANLHGSVGIESGLGKDSGSGDNTVDFKGIVFENMLLQTESPKLSVTYFGYRGSMSIAGFPISLNELGLRTPSDGKAELVFDFNINLTSESDGGNGGGAKLAIKAIQVDHNGRDKWEYDGIDLERVFVQMEVAGMELKGAVFIFDDDPTYGKGFAGAVGAKFSTGMKLEVEAKALFGRTDEFRYWFADAQVTLPQGIPIFTGFAINSFGGGFFNRMKMAGVTYQEDAAYMEIGASVSGVIYEPSKENGFGFKASVGIITQSSESLFHGSLEFGISFLTSGGLQEIYFKGEGELIASLPGNFYEMLGEKLGHLASGTSLPAYAPTGAMSANVMIKFDFVNDVFHATSELYINFGILKGVGPNGRAGWLDFYVGPDTWHILIGTPEDPTGVIMDIGILKMTTKSYFMLGDDIPGSPPPPPIVAELLGVDVSELDYTRDLNMLESGRGFAFGSHFEMSSDLKFLMYYASFRSGIGFDIMVKDYGEAHCKGSSGPVGLDGWYANGQAYGYFQGKMGVKFRLFGKKKKVTIFSGGAAVLLQARLPNPVWLRGYLKGRYSVLGGLIKGSFRFKIELGDYCEIVDGSPIDGIVVIGDMTPKDGTTEVDVFGVPQVSFNLQINKVFEIPDDTGDHRYKVLVDKFEVLDNGTPIIGEVKWNSYNSLASFYSHEILPPNTDLKAYVQLHFEEYINGKWEVIMDNGRPALETKEVSFTTGLAPDNIPLTNIDFMYPVLDQKNFFINEYGTGYITLKRGQKYLFDNAPGFSKSMIMGSETGGIMSKTFGYNSGEKQITYVLPKEMSTKNSYDIRISLIPPESATSNSIKESYTKQSFDDEGNDENTVEIKSNSLEGLEIKGDERLLLTYSFGTSEYTTFAKKMADADKVFDLYDHIPYPYGVALKTRIQPMEPFDISELTGTAYSGNQPLVVARAVMDNDFYKKKVYPLLYKEYPLAGQFSVRRSTEKVGVPPVEGVEPISWYLTSLENDIPADQYNYFIPYRYDLGLYYYRDYEDLRYQLISSDLNWEHMIQYEQLITKPFPLMDKGNYKTTLKYILPGAIKEGTSENRKYYNPIYE